jgi:putative transcriptional regulator
MFPQTMMHIQLGQNTHLLVREVRRRLGLTQEQFAARLGVTFPTINRWENAKARPSKMAQKLLKGVLLELGDNGADLLNSYFVPQDSTK